jgi:regulator of protease activity HflC (stomatin/prohibitin superfamily)
MKFTTINANTHDVDDNGFGFFRNNGGFIARLIAIGIAGIIVLVIIINVVQATRINAGYVGVEVNLAGTQRGAQDIPVRTGWVFYSPLKTQIIQFPTFVQTVKWTSDTSEGHPLNEELIFNSKEGQEVRADVSLSYAIDSLKVPEFYVKYRADDLEKFTHGILKDIVRNSLNEVASTYKLEDIYGENKANFLREARERVQAAVSPVGVGIQQFGFIGKPRFTAAIEQAITQKTQAITEAERARNQLAVTKAEMNKTVAEAEGEAKSAIERARGEAESAIQRARGEAESNRLRQASITPQLMEWRRLENERARIEKWDGQLPRMIISGKPSMFMSLPNEMKDEK